MFVFAAAVASCSDSLPPEHIQRATFDNNIANVLIAMTTELVQTHIGGSARGQVNTTVNCRGGGTADISGSITAAESGVVTRDLTFVLHDCFRVDSIVYNYGTSRRSLRVTGTLKRNADFGTAFIRGLYESVGPLEIAGTMHLVLNKAASMDPVIAESCTFIAVDEPATTHGQYCGRTFLY